MKQRRKFTHNKCIYVCTTQQKIGNSNYEKAVKIHYLGSVIIGWNAKNNTPIDEIIEQAKRSIDAPERFVL
jgi:hypothetical protein